MFPEIIHCSNFVRVQNTLLVFKISFKKCLICWYWYACPSQLPMISITFPIVNIPHLEPRFPNLSRPNLFHIWNKDALQASLNFGWFKIEARGDWIGDKKTRHLCQTSIRAWYPVLFILTPTDLNLGSINTHSFSGAVIAYCSTSHIDRSSIHHYVFIATFVPHAWSLWI